jgi:hypothetical protein
MVGVVMGNICHGATCCPWLSSFIYVFFPTVGMSGGWHESCGAGRVPSVPNRPCLTDKKHDEKRRMTWTQLIDMANQ